jgi:exodeoxyribonuclease-3
MRVITFNANGIRSATKKGFFDWFYQQDADVLCIQETKAQEYQLDDDLFCHNEYERYFFDAVKLGYSGVAIYTRCKPDQVIKGLGFPLCDTEGRYIEAQYGDVSIISLYLPSGSSGEERQIQKFKFMKLYQEILEKQIHNKRHYIICGDFNIIHKKIDIKNWASNQKSSGCLPEERAWLDYLFEMLGWVDAFRILNQEPDQYTWFSERAKAWDKNVGWRIDYQMVSPALRNCIKAVSIYRQQKFSDHAPVIVDYDLTLTKGNQPYA